MTNRLSRGEMLRLSMGGALGISALGALEACGHGLQPALQPLTSSPAGLGANLTGPVLTVTNATQKFKDSQIHFYVIGLDSNGDLSYVTKQSTLAKCALSDNGPSGYTDYSIPLGTLGKAKISLFQLSSARVYFTIGEKLKIQINKNSKGEIAYTSPSGWTSTDPNYNLLFDMIEYTYNSGGINCNTSTVDMFSIPLTIQLIGNTNASSGALKSGGRRNIFSEMKAHPAFAPLVVGNNLRVIAPGHGIDAGVFSSTFLDQYINDVWKHYASNTMTATSSVYGTYTGKVESGSFNFYQNNSKQFGFSKPSTSDVFYCNGALAAPNNALGAVAAILGASINRGVATIASQPHCDKTSFYKNTKSNHYAQILHANTQGYNCYGFAFDDVCNYSTDLSDSSPASLNITLTSWL